MKIANLSEADKQKLYEFEDRMGVVLVAYSPDQEQKSHAQNNTTTQSPSM